MREGEPLREIDTDREREYLSLSVIYQYAPLARTRRAHECVVHTRRALECVAHSPRALEDVREEKGPGVGRASVSTQTTECVQFVRLRV